MRKRLLFAIAVSCFAACLGEKASEEGLSEEGMKRESDREIKPRKSVVKTFGDGFEKTETTEYDSDTKEKLVSKEIAFKEMKRPSIDEIYQPDPLNRGIQSFDASNKAPSFEEMIPTQFTPVPFEIPIPMPMPNSGIVIIKRGHLKRGRSSFRQETLSPFGLLINDMLSDIAAMTNRNSETLVPGLAENPNEIQPEPEQKEEINTDIEQTDKDDEEEEKSNEISMEENNNTQLQNNITLPLTYSSFESINYKQAIVFFLLGIVIVSIIKYLFSRFFQQKGFENQSINSSDEDEIRKLKFIKSK